MSTDVRECDCTRGVQTHVRESAPKVDSGRKSLATPGNRTCVSGMKVRCSNQLSYIPSPSHPKYPSIRTLYVAEVVHQPLMAACRIPIRWIQCTKCRQLLAHVNKILFLSVHMGNTGIKFIISNLLQRQMTIYRKFNLYVLKKKKKSLKQIWLSELTASKICTFCPVSSDQKAFF